MSDPKVVLGIIDCLTCNAEVQLKETKKERAFYTCSECSSQLFTRGKKSSDLMILKIKKPVSVQEKKQDDSVTEKKGFFNWLEDDE